MCGDVCYGRMGRAGPGSESQGKGREGKRGRECVDDGAKRKAGLFLFPPSPPLSLSISLSLSLSGSISPLSLSLGESTLLYEFAALSLQRALALSESLCVWEA